MAKKEENFSLEEGFSMLEKTVEELEKEEISLEESFEVYKQGMELLKKCNEAIDGVEKKVRVMNEKGETNEF